MPRADRTSSTRPARRPASRRRAPAATVVLLVRHCTTTTTGKELPGRAPGLHLSDRGRAEADRVATRILAMTGGARPAGAAGDGARATDGKDPRVAAVYASPLERTRETAEPIAGALGRDVAVEDGLIEVDVGEWTGLDLKAARKRKEWATIQRYPSGFAFPGGESFLAMQARIVSTLDRLRAAHPGETIVAVSHADPIRAAVNHAVGAHLDMFQRFVVSPGSLTAIAYGPDGPTVLAVNDTAATDALVPS
jgi:broad specificity phosphatase PhoE